MKSGDEILHPQASMILSLFTLINGVSAMLEENGGDIRINTLNTQLLLDFLVVFICHVLFF